VSWLAVFAGLLLTCGEKDSETWNESSKEWGLTAEFEGFQPLDGFALDGNDLRLPYKSNGHAAHGDNTEDENEADIGLVSGKAKNAPKPSHG
jgi:hypothetical protein